MDLFDVAIVGFAVYGIAVFGIAFMERVVQGVRLEYKALYGKTKPLQQELEEAAVEALQIVEQVREAKNVAEVVVEANIEVNEIISDGEWEKKKQEYAGNIFEAKMEEGPELANSGWIRDDLEAMTVKEMRSIYDIPKSLRKKSRIIEYLLEEADPAQLRIA